MEFKIAYKRPIRAVFYEDYKATRILKTTRGNHPENMVLCCIKHMRHNDYGARIAEVFDEDDGVLHAVVKFKVFGAIEVIYQRGVKE